jgi:glycosyltransferase involved in cell wall biosynthesis
VSVLFLLTTPPPVISGTDAVVQEVELLRSRFGGEVIYLRPSWRARSWYPTSLLGLHRLHAITHCDRRVDVCHVFASQLFHLPVLRAVTRPIVYTVTSGVGPEDAMPSLAYLRRLGAIIVPGRADLKVLTDRGLPNVELILPGIDVNAFVDAAAPSGPDFVLLAGSAPWARQHFQTKGVNAMLEVARTMPDLRLVFLWRGVLLQEVMDRVRRLGLLERVEILRDRVDVSRVLTRVHAAVVLATGPGLVRAYPHSLLEALAAGRPVILSDGNPMAEYVRAMECGRVVPGADVHALAEAISDLRQNYERFRARAREIGKRDFSQERLVAAYRSLYGALAT